MRSQAGRLGEPDFALGKTFQYLPIHGLLRGRWWEGIVVAVAAGPLKRETWGWDFRGGLIPRVVKLAWTYPSRYQGGEGQYKPDGPKFPSKTPENLFAPH